jgi:5-(carboxyamino)imidazole ribonucleotide mutase
MAFAVGKFQLMLQLRSTPGYYIKHNNMNPSVGIIMGSDSDLSVMQAAADILKEFSIPFELTVVSAHRTPLRMVEYAQKARERGLKVIIAGAGGAAHLPGMVASLTTLPVIGVPVKSSNSIDGWDSVLSILQMPNGVPVATVALNAAKNAGILAAQIVATADNAVALALETYKHNMNQEVLEKAERLKTSGWSNSFDQ